MRVLLDTNVLIAAFISKGVCHELFLHVCDQHNLILSEYILQELKNNLRNKFHYSEHEVQQTINLVKERAEIVSPKEIFAYPIRDPNDQPILAAAVTGGCHCLITGDKDLLEAPAIKKMPILSPNQFWKFEKTA